MWREGLISAYSSQSVTPSRRKGRAETAAKAGESCTLALSACFLTALRTSCPRVAPPAVLWALPHGASNKKTALQICPGVSLMGARSHLKLFLQNDSSVCPDDIKEAYTSDPDAATYYDGNLFLIGHEDP